jgi:hypothetical protein
MGKEYYYGQIKPPNFTSGFVLSYQLDNTSVLMRQHDGQNSVDVTKVTIVGIVGIDFPENSVAVNFNKGQFARHAQVEQQKTSTLDYPSEQLSPKDGISLELSLQPEMM